MLPAYDFSLPLVLTPEERYRCIMASLTKRGQVITRSTDSWYPEHAEVYPTLPEEYILFLSLVHEIYLDYSVNLWGDGEHSDIPFPHGDQESLLVVGDYWRYADGDQLILNCSPSSGQVFLYLHDDGARLVPFAPSFSLAAWRILYEDF